jgi:hypothetical protein
MLLGDKLFELPRTDRPVRHTYFSSSSLRTHANAGTHSHRLTSFR